MLTVGPVYPWQVQDFTPPEWDDYEALVAAMTEGVE